MASDAELRKYMEILAKIGGIISLIQSIIGFFWGSWLAIVGPIIGIIVSVLVILSAFKPDKPIPYNAIIILIFGIILVVFTPAWIGGILVLVAGILGLVAKS